MSLMKADINIAELWDRFDTPLRAFVSRRVRSPEAVEDILQDIYVKIHTKVGGLQKPERLQSWIFQIARNCVIDYYRKRRSNVELNVELPAGDEQREERELQLELEEMVRGMVERLPPIYRDALAATELGGLKQAEAAQRHGVSLPGMKSRVQRGRRMLREMLLDCCHFHFDRLGQVIDYEPRCRRCCDAGAAC